jgi:hypothetical protein
MTRLLLTALSVLSWQLLSWRAGKEHEVKCPKCGRFVAKPAAHHTHENEIRFVTGICRKHGVVVLTDWDYEDFFPPKEPAHD